MGEHDVRLTVLLSFQRALLGNVPPSLRGLTVGWDQDTVRAIAYFDGIISDRDRESMSLVEAEVCADLDPIYTLRFDLIQLDAPEPLTPLKAWVFLRRED